MDREKAKIAMSKLIDVFRKEYPNGGAFAAIHATGGHSLINEIYDTHEAELKEKVEEIETAKKIAQDAYTLGASQAAEMDRFWEAFGLLDENISVDDAVS